MIRKDSGVFRRRESQVLRISHRRRRKGALESRGVVIRRGLCRFHCCATRERERDPSGGDAEGLKSSTPCGQLRRCSERKGRKCPAKTTFTPDTGWSVPLGPRQHPKQRFLVPSPPLPRGRGENGTRTTHTNLWMSLTLIGHDANSMVFLSYYSQATSRISNTCHLHRFQAPGLS